MQTDAPTTAVQEKITAENMLELLEQAQDFLLDSLDDYNVKLDNPADIEAMDEETKVAFFIDREQYKYVLDVTEMIELAINRGKPAYTMLDWCPECKERFAKEDKRKILFCSACGQKIERL